VAAIKAAMKLTSHVCFGLKEPTDRPRL